jgi:PKD repeat protein
MLGGFNNNQFFNGEWPEYLFYNRVLSTNETSLVERYLMDKYAPPINLGVDITPTYQNNGSCVNEIIAASNIYTNYLWSNNATTASIQVSQPGTYWVQTTDIFGRTSIDTIIVNKPKMSIFNFQDTLTCPEDSIIISPILPTNHSFVQWSNGYNFQTQSFNTQNYSQSFFIEFSNNSGCIIQSNSFKILVDSSIVGISLGQDTSLCSGNPIQLQNPLTNIEQYSWNTGNNQSTQMVDTAGQYILEVTNSNGCSNSDTIIVTISGEGPQVNLTLPSILCEDDSLLLSVSTSISSPETITSISWDLDDGAIESGDSVSVFYQNFGTKNIQVSVLASNGCSVNLQQIIQINPNPTIQIQTVGTCLYDTIVFSTINNGFNIQNYEWELGQNTSSFVSTPSHVYNSSGTYTINVQVTDLNGCQSSIQTSIELSEELELYNNSLTVIWPKHNEVISERTPFLSWNGIEGIQLYQIWLSQDSTFALGVQSFTSSNTQFQLVNNLLSGNWFWKVKGSFNNQNFVSNLGKFQVFEPTDISDLKIWYNAENVVVSGNNVTKWTDLSGNNLHATQNSTSLQPILLNNAINGKPALKFFDDQLNTLIFNSSYRTEFLLLKRNGNPNGSYHSIVIHPSTPFNQIFIPSSTNLFNSYIGSSPINSNTLFDSDKYSLISRNISINNTVFRKNATQTASNSISPIGSFNDVLMLGGFNNNQFFNGEWPEYLFYNRVLSTNETSLVERFLMDKYAPPVNLGADITPIYQNNGNCVNETLSATNTYANYLWSNNATTASIQVTQPGMYWVQTTDIFGRTSRDTIIVNNPTMNIFDEVELKCFNSETSLIAEIPSNHSFIKWNNCNPNLSNQIQFGNKYFVEFTNNQGCIIKSNLFSVGIDSSLANITLGVDTNLCSGNNIQLQNTPANITQFSWDTGNTQASQNVDTSGFYMLEVTNSNNCQNRDTVWVDVIGTSPTLNYSFPASICQFSEGQFQDNSEVPNGNGTINNKTWSISEGSNFSGSSGTFAIDTAGTFNVNLLVETEQGCSSSTTFPLTVHPKPILSFTTQNYCPYEAVEFTPTNSTFSILNSTFWDFDDNSTSNNSNPTNVFGTTGTYNVSLQAQDINGCRDTVTQVVYIQPAPVATFSFINTCEETEVNFTNNSNISDTFNITTNTWTYGDGTQEINPSFQKIYADADTFDVQLIVTANNGCQDTSMQSIIIYPRPTLGWQVGPACKNTWTTFENLSSVSVGNIAQTDWMVNLQYPLEGSSSAYQFVTNGVQYLNLTSTTDNGCQRDTLIIVNVQPEINASFTVSPETIVAGVPTVFTSTSTGATQYTWNLGNSNIIQTTVAEPVEATGFDASLIGDSVQTSLIIENTIGCRDTAMQYIKVYEPRIDLAINQLFVQDLNGFFKVGVELRNQGFVEITKTDLLLKMYGSMPIMETENESLAPGESRIYLFNASPSAYISTQDNETSYLCVEATSYNDYQLIETELSNNISCLNTEGDNFVLLPIYPNPTNDDISYTFILSEEATLETSLTDETGRIVLEQSELHSAGLHTQILSMRNLSAGVYYFHISDGNSAKTVKILKN